MAWEIHTEVGYKMPVNNFSYSLVTYSHKGLYTYYRVSLNEILELNALPELIRVKACQLQLAYRLAKWDDCLLCAVTDLERMCSSRHIHSKCPPRYRCRVPALYASRRI